MNWRNIKWLNVASFALSSTVAVWCFGVGNPVMTIMGFLNVGAALLQVVIIYMQLTQKGD